LKLERKIALVTGAAKRIGRATALELARQGCDVAVHCHTSVQEADETVQMIRQLGRRAAVFDANLANPDETTALPARVVASFGGLNILINNASTFDPMTVDSFSLGKWNETIGVNLSAPMLLSHAAWPYLKADGEGRIVNLTDICADRPWPDHLAYCVSKAGLTCLTVALAKAMAPQVFVNAVAVGAAVAPEHYSPEQVKEITRNTPAMRLGTVEEVAATVCFLVSGSDYITGAILACDGGRSIAW
jgi:pteridine reductase